MSRLTVGCRVGAVRVGYWLTSEQTVGREFRQRGWREVTPLTLARLSLVTPLLQMQ